MALMTLHQYLAREERENSVPHELTTLLLSVADAAKNIRACRRSWSGRNGKRSGRGSEETRCDQQRDHVHGE